MKTRLLFPHRYKMIGWILAVPFFILGIFQQITEYEFPFLALHLNENTERGLGNLFNNQNFTDELIVVGLSVGLLLIAFSKEKIEDEFVTRVRLESLQWAVFLNAVIMIICTVCIYGGLYLSVIVYNMFTPLIFFILRFHYIMYWKKPVLIADN